jgi:ATP-binding cassette subfamily F protein 3
MIRVSGLRKSYGREPLFEDVSFSLQSGEKLGVVGRNGHGKSTLFKILMKEEHEDGGEIQIPKNYKVGYLSQHLKFTHPTILEEVCEALPVYEGGWREEYKAEEMLQGLGFKRADFSRPPSSFSGGFQIRLNLAKLLLSEPNLLLLDEPTNYLDIVAVRWLRRFLQDWQGELMLITHDREFMDEVCTHTMAIHRQRAKKLLGNTEKLYAQILQEEEIYEKTRQNSDKQRREIEKFVERFRAKASKAKAVQSRVKLLEKMEVREELSEIQSLDFRFREAQFPGKFIGHVTDLSFGYDAGDLLFKNLTFTIGKQDRIGVIGPNGRGKTTLLSLLAGERKPVSGSMALSSNAIISYFGQTNISRLDLNRSIEEELMHCHPEHSRAVARSIAGLMMFEGDNALKKIKVLSGGERSRVLLGKILVTPSNCLLLDEPTNHLDMDSIESLMEAVDAFQGAIVIVTHSEEILRRVCNRLVVFDRNKAELFEGNYDDFLRRVGWESEEEDQPEAPVISKTRDTQEISKKIKSCEKTILELESEEKKLSSELEACSVAGKTQELIELNRRYKELKSEIELKFAELETLDRELRQET